MRFIQSIGLLAAGVIGLLPASAGAAVADSSATGFTVKVAVTISAQPEEVYRRLVHNVGDWWNGEHTYSGDPHNLSIEEKAMGCFCEKLPEGGAVRHMEVINMAPGKRLVLTGGIGPLQAQATTGTLSFLLSPAPGGTKLDVTYAVAGYLPNGMNTWAGPVDSVIAEQVTRLKSLIEKGRPDAK